MCLMSFYCCHLQVSLARTLCRPRLPSNELSPRQGLWWLEGVCLKPHLGQETVCVSAVLAVTSVVTRHLPKSWRHLQMTLTCHKWSCRWWCRKVTSLTRHCVMWQINRRWWHKRTRRWHHVTGVFRVCLRCLRVVGVGCGGRTVCTPVNCGHVPPVYYSPPTRSPHTYTWGVWEGEGVGVDISPSPGSCPMNHGCPSRGSHRWKVPTICGHCQQMAAQNSSPRLIGSMRRTTRRSGLCQIRHAHRRNQRDRWSAAPPAPLRQVVPTSDGASRADGPTSMTCCSSSAMNTPHSNTTSVPPLLRQQRFRFHAAVAPPCSGKAARRTLCFMPRMMAHTFLCQPRLHLVDVLWHRRLFRGASRPRNSSSTGHQSTERRHHLWHHSGRIVR